MNNFYFQQFGQPVAPANNAGDASQTKLSPPSIEARALLLLVCVGLATLLWPVYPEDGITAFAGMLSIFIALGAGIMINPYYPAIPQFAVALFGIQHVICPLIYYHHPELAESFPVTTAFMETFKLSCWATAIFAGTVLIVTAGCHVQKSVDALQQKLTPAMRSALIRWSWMAWISTSVLTLSTSGLPFASLAFLWTLFLSLQVVSMVTLIYLLPREQCNWFVALVIAVHVVQALQSTFFSHVVTASTIALLVLAHRRSWRVKLALVLVVGIIISAAIQSEKFTFREIAWYKQGQSFTLSERVGYWAEELPERISHFSSGLTAEKMWPLIERMNQGKIVEQIVKRVPDDVSTADGETLVMSAKLVIPRVLWEDKPAFYSHEMFRKYTGYPLHAVSMGVGFLGEFYLNFGSYALLGFFCYALSVAVISRFWIKRGAVFPLWWAWYFYIMNYWFRFEIDFPKALNYTVKAAFIFICLIMMFRVWQLALGLAGSSRSSKVNVQEPLGGTFEAVGGENA